MPRRVDHLANAEAALRDFALAYPGAHEDFPWGERAIKVRGKVFLFMRRDDERLSTSTKLPDSNGVALAFPFAEPTGYGLGKSGWVTTRFTAEEAPPVELLEQWIDESYRAVAPAKLVAQLAASADRVPDLPSKPAPRPRRKRSKPPASAS